MALFEARSTRLERVTIKNAAHVSTRGLRVLKAHKIHELEAVGLCRVSNSIMDVARIENSTETISIKQRPTTPKQFTITS